MSVQSNPRMTADQFLLWLADRDAGRFELVAGEPVAMAPERSGHALTKARVWRALDEAIRSAGRPCVAYPDGMAVVIDEQTVYEPEVLVRCGAPLDADAIRIEDPVIVVEVLSPSSEARDAGAKLADYVRFPTLRHYVLVDPKTRVLVRHRIRPDAAGGEPFIATQIIAMEPSTSIRRGSPSRSPTSSNEPSARRRGHADPAPDRSRNQERKMTEPVLRRHQAA